MDFGWSYQITLQILLKTQKRSAKEKKKKIVENLGSIQLRKSTKEITKLPFVFYWKPRFNSITNFQNQTQKKIYNKFPNQLRKKKKSIPCSIISMGNYTNQSSDDKVEASRRQIVRQEQRHVIVVLYLYTAEAGFLVPWSFT